MEPLWQRLTYPSSLICKNYNPMILFAPYSPTTLSTSFALTSAVLPACRSLNPTGRRVNPWCDAAFINRRGPWSGHPTRRFIQTSDPVSCN